MGEKWCPTPRGAKSSKDFSMQDWEKSKKRSGEMFGTLLKTIGEVKKRRKQKEEKLKGTMISPMQAKKKGGKLRNYKLDFR